MKSRVIWEKRAQWSREVGQVIIDAITPTVSIQRLEPRMLFGFPRSLGQRRGMAINLSNAGGRRRANPVGHLLGLHSRIYAMVMTAARKAYFANAIASAQSLPGLFQALWGLL